MSMTSKLAGLAQKALNKSGSSDRGSNSNSNSNSNSDDWRSIVRSAADALIGDGRPASSARPTAVPAPVRQTPASPAAVPSAVVSDADRSAIARDDYLLKTADPRQIEQVHREAFERHTPVQRSIGNEAEVLAIRKAPTVERAGSK
ncbi:hypothetical protein [Cryobacterium sp. Y57]|uniref:hypothetical protein n=1 Tax=Cryobacterium sp. Y57 TaxID=2048287 RepID=UPI000CE3D6C4|nr:hypothetical protein [Cryobacterium sp. Y57]